MQKQRIPDEDPAGGLSEEEMDNTVIGFMLGGECWPWSLDEIVRECGDRIDAEDAVARLAAAGLIHRLGEFVFPTRTARRADELRIGSV